MNRPRTDGQRRMKMLLSGASIVLVAVLAAIAASIAVSIAIDVGIWLFGS